MQRHQQLNTKPPLVNFKSVAPLISLRITVWCYWNSEVKTSSAEGRYKQHFQVVVVVVVIGHGTVQNVEKKQAELHSFLPLFLLY